MTRIHVRRDAEHWYANNEGDDEVLAVGLTRAEVVAAVRAVARSAAPASSLCIGATAQSIGVTAS